MTRSKESVKAFSLRAQAFRATLEAARATSAEAEKDLAAAIDSLPSEVGGKSAGVRWDSLPAAGKAERIQRVEAAMAAAEALPKPAAPDLQPEANGNAQKPVLQPVREVLVVPTTATNGSAPTDPTQPAQPEPTTATEGFAPEVPSAPEQPATSRQRIAALAFACLGLVASLIGIGLTWQRATTPPEILRAIHDHEASLQERTKMLASVSAAEALFVETSRKLKDASHEIGPADARASEAMLEDLRAMVNRSESARRVAEARLRGATVAEKDAFDRLQASLRSAQLSGPNEAAVVWLVALLGAAGAFFALIVITAGRARIRPLPQDGLPALYAIPPSGAALAAFLYCLLRIPVESAPDRAATANLDLTVVFGLAVAGGLLAPAVLHRLDQRLAQPRS